MNLIKTDLVKLKHCNRQNHLLNDVKCMLVYIWDMYDFDPVWIIEKLKLCTQFLF